MEYKKFGSTFAVRINRGEEVIAQLEKLCKTENIYFAKVSAIGAADKITVGLYNVEQKKYFKKTFIGEAEITSLLGNITEKDGEPYIHLHINAADENLNAFGGHLNECVISGTCEMFVDEISGNTGRAYDSKTGLNLFDFS